MRCTPCYALMLLLASCTGAADGEDASDSAGADAGPASPDGGAAAGWTCAPYTGPTPSPVSGTPGELLWTFEHYLQVEFAPAVAPDGTIVVQGKRGQTTPDDAGTLVAVDPAGNLLWSAVTDPGSVPAPPATVYCDTVLAPGTWNNGDLNARLYRFELDGGAALDPIELHGPVGDGIAVGHNGTVYAPATDLHAIDGDQVAWQYPMVGDGKTGSNAAVGPSGTIYVGARGLNDHNLHAVGPDGRELWKRDTGRAIIDPIAIDNDERVYALNAGGLLSVFEKTGELAWYYQFDSDHSGGGMVIGPDGTVYVGTIGPTPGQYDGEYLFAVRQGASGDGELVWRTRIGLSWIGTTPALSAGGTLYVSDFCRNIVAVRAADGEELWSYAVPEAEQGDICAGFSAPAIGENGAVYVWNEGTAAGQGGGLYAFVGDGTGPAKSPWPQEGQNAAHTGLVRADELE